MPLLSTALPRMLRRPLSTTLSVTDHLGRTRSRYQMPIVTRRRGLDVMHDPLLNRGTGFRPSERQALSLRGLLPPRYLSLDDQRRRIMDRVRSVEEPIKKYEVLSGLRDRNVELFYYTLQGHMRELTPIVYTPTVGLACQKFSEMFRRAQGMFFSSEDKGHFHEMVYNWPEDDVDVIVVTDGGRVLGLGDLGAGAMGISVGKSILYVAAGGIEPSRILPVMLDVGTDNKDLLEDPWYMGTSRERIRGEEYFELVDEFLDAVRVRWPNVLVQFEDFSSHCAAEVLRRYRKNHLCFNDDIQGTGSMTLGGLLSASNGTPLRDQKIVLAGAGSAGMGIAGMIRRWMTVHEGLTVEEANRRFWVIDMHGLVTTARDDIPLAEEHIGFARDAGGPGFAREGACLAETVRETGATVLLGVSGQPGIFDEEVVRAVAANTETPIVFPMSNPTSKCEATAEDVLRWTDGRATFASGSPFDAVTLDDGRVISVSQANNIYVFPAMGLASVICEPTRISEEMFLAAAKRLSELVTDEERAAGHIYPPIDKIREVAVHVAVAVSEAAWDMGIALAPRPENLEDTVRELMYKPGYDPLVPHHGGRSTRPHPNVGLIMG